MPVDEIEFLRNGDANALADFYVGECRTLDPEWDDTPDEPVFRIIRTIARLVLRAYQQGKIDGKDED